MKAWRMIGLSVLVTVTAVRLAGATDSASKYAVKDADGKVLAVAVICSGCQSPAGGAKCATGVEAGWFDGKACGKCLIEANAPARILYPYDLHFTGTLVDDKGEPAKHRFIKMFLPNGWAVRTRTSDKGEFRLMLGATQERTSKTPLVTDIGTHVDSMKTDVPFYAVYLLPESYTECPPAAAKSGTKKPNQKGK